MLTPSQQRGVTVLLAILFLILAVRLSMNTMTVPFPATAPGPRAGELADRIDPNTATAAELAAIPDLGEKRAAAIVEFRRQFLARFPNRQPFKRVSDLEQIKGIGPAISENMEPYLKFPTTGK